MSLDETKIGVPQETPTILPFAPPTKEAWALTEEEWHDPQILQMVEACRFWQEGNEVTAKTIVPFIYNLMERAYTILADRQGQERKRILLATLLHALDTKPDWADEEEKDAVVNIVRKTGEILLFYGNINIKEKVFGIIQEVKDCAAECGQACGCFGASDL
jgi:hypothetical protein